MRMGSCGYVPLCQALVVAASRGLGSAMLIRLREAPGAFHQGSGFPPWVDGGGWMGSQVVKYWLPVLIIGSGSDDTDYI
jgi:hypothetical protein